MPLAELTTMLSWTPDAKHGLGVSEHVILVAEDELTVKIRGGYRDFLRAYGWLEFEAHEVFGLGDNVPKHLDLVSMTLHERSDCKPNIPPHLVPVMADGFGNHYCLDTRVIAGGEHPVVFWDHERGREQTPQNMKMTFSEWLAWVLSL